MKIVIMRHGEAEHYADSDAERALTEAGQTASAAVARVFAKQSGLDQFDKVLVSPYLRAQQTWQAISGYFSVAKVETCDDITPYGQAEDVFEYLVALIQTEQLETLLIISHLPLVGYLVAELVAGLPAPMFPTSGAIGLEFDPETRQASVLWNVYP
ncbi:phosphohistidine phosphatase SixA [Vibrio metschnikovii]|uniref:Phosphohistidine phosphatase SixA n=6 Tax=Unclassified Bacteria TaxID=49928 RepID=A0AAU6SVG1_UNCXX|nr:MULTISPECIES: phosphohistidine phosphatase SixA [Vibrio]EKO3564407.1 phosphohistidine phosphatase SixA [Vibrio metschnikovii]EKO3568897.1 phosphohistidine phosphatase SixA [Vibrio metschnikovii]EKO3571792.1 phosphohistidine phosphatase SixA [Vibrio metschnikovii]EKO3574753.1 phosphohistidine phosphatase SixA [Vibrio metschnikovii]EKO3579739.1 phosphohistidine phosphatase SixA [Vibrio metschnikovii]